MQKVKTKSDITVDTTKKRILRQYYDKLIPPSKSDIARFESLCKSAANRGITTNAENKTYEFSGIGTLGEKTLHAVMKEYYRCGMSTEVSVGKYVADIAGGNEVMEIQTGSFTPLRAKLNEYLKDHRVTVVYPIPYFKWIAWIDTETGDINSDHKSPKRGTSSDAFLELCRIREHLTNPNFHLILAFVNLTEYRYLNGWSRDKKRGSVRCDRIPCALAGEIRFNTSADYVKLLPPVLPDTFTAKELALAIGIRTGTRKLSAATSVLRAVGVIEACGKSSNAIIYKRTATAENE